MTRLYWRQRGGYTLRPVLLWPEKLLMLFLLGFSLGLYLGKAL